MKASAPLLHQGPSEESRHLVELMVLDLLNNLNKMRGTVQEYQEHHAAIGDVLALLEAQANLDFLTKVYGYGLDLLRLAVQQSQEATQ